MTEDVARKLVFASLSVLLLVWGPMRSARAEMGAEAGSPTRPTASSLHFGVSPNPAARNQRVTFVATPDTASKARLQVWVNATGLSRPDLGNLPAGSWAWECCPPQTGGAPAWHYASDWSVAPSSYRFSATARAAGKHQNTAGFGILRATVTLQVHG